MASPNLGAKNAPSTKLAAAAPAKPRPVEGPVRGREQVMLRYEFYRDGFRAMVTILPIVGLALVGSVGLNIAQYRRPDINHYFAVDPDNRITEIKALREPYVNDAKLLSWVSERVTKAYRMDPVNYKSQVAEMAMDFTPEGYESYIESLKSSGVIEFMTKNLLVSSAIPTGTPLVVERNITPSGVYYWRVQVPVLVSYTSATKVAQKKRVIEVVVVRRHTVEAASGIGISQFVATDTN
jgi:intracellular multiplication protein IcmL